MPGIPRNFVYAILNINGALSNAEKPEENWVNRAALLVRTARRYSPDLLGLQEVEFSNLAFLQEELSEYEFELGSEFKL